MSRKHIALRQRCIRRIKHLLLAAFVCGFSPSALSSPPGLAKNPDSQPDSSKKTSVVLDSTVTIFQSSDEPESVQKAVNDLARDFELVLGKRPKVVNREEDAGAVTILAGEQGKLPEVLRPGNLSG